MLVVHGDQKVVQLGEFKKEDLAGRLIISTLQGLFVPRAGAKMLVKGGDYCVLIGNY